MIDPGRVIHCANACGRYTSLAAMASKPASERWVEDQSVAGGGGAYLCPHCSRGRIKAKTRAALRDGVRLDTRSLSAAQREAAAEVLGPELLAAIDGGWGGE